MKKKRILGIGNALVDMLVRVNESEMPADLRLLKGGMKLLSDEEYELFSRELAGLNPKRATGGSACNTILALGNLGAQPALAGKIGPDDNGDFFELNCRTHGITPYLLRSTLRTGVASTFITPDGERTFGTYLGAAAMELSDFKEEWLEGFDIVYTEGYLVSDPALLERIVQTAKAAGKEVALDLSIYNVVRQERDFFRRLLRDVDIVFANEEEARAFSGSGSIRVGLDALGEICKTAVVKTGPKGCVAKRGVEVLSMPARPVSRVVDSTGAGDYFSAGFLYGYAQGDALGECLRKATILAAYVIGEEGTTLTDEAWKSIRKEVRPL